jgi:cell division protein FtsA
MQINIPILFVEINELNYIFVSGIYDENQNFKIVEKIISPNNGINKNKFSSIDDANKTIKKNIELIENKLNYIFKNVILILDNFDCTCINISGYKKLNGSQVVKENIFYILNSLKTAISENEKKKNILHIFNSKSFLDGNSVKNLPIGLFGDFYNHELTFFLIQNNDLKNIKQVFNKSNLEVKKIFLKNFSEGTQLINQNKTETFFKIKISKYRSSIIFFDHASFKYSEDFSFGYNIILKDVSKICSLEEKIIEKIMSDNFLIDTKFNENPNIDEKFFKGSNYRKIKKKLILDIANSRIEEIADIIFCKNINIKYFKNSNFKIYLTIQDNHIFKNFNENFINYFAKKIDNSVELIDAFNVEDLIMNTSKLSTFGWKNEAVPIIQTKNSLITKIFKSIFG